MMPVATIFLKQYLSVLPTYNVWGVAEVVLLPAHNTWGTAKVGLLPAYNLWGTAKVVLLPAHNLWGTVKVGLHIAISSLCYKRILSPLNTIL